MEGSMILDSGGFAALENHHHHLNVKCTFSKKNGTSSLPQPSQGRLRYSDKDICSKKNGAMLTRSMNLKEKSLDTAESKATNSDYKDELPKHSFINHYMSDPTYNNSWKHQTLAARPRCLTTMRSARRVSVHPASRQRSPCRAQVASTCPQAWSPVLTCCSLASPLLTGFSSFV
ncbi:protein sidekick-1-like [Trichechus manatus latirostris]|uniref:Protein sidekick-1-like n=1 Tax=Trichechus manatus latirostris TaxID=127582 RepID=A0A2Y9R9L4_TRIMA|nr:protein sidekick-1-like [Trichechus manatus latirostris]